MVTVTTKAADKLKEIMEAENRTGQALRIMVKSGGCSGYSYAMGFDTEQHDEDIVFEQHGIRMMIDPDSLRLPAGNTSGLRRNVDGRRVRHQQPERGPHVRMRPVVPHADDEGEPELC